MTKEQARKKLALAASRQGLKVQMKSGKVKDAIRILNASGKVVAEGTIALDASKGYVNSDVLKTVNQINTKLGKQRNMNASRRRRMNSACSGKEKMNASDDEYIQDDAEFVDDVESIVTDEQGNEIVVEEMLVVQDPETNEISLFVPTEEDETVPENVEVIGEVVTADDETTLDSSRKRVKTKASKRTRR